MGFSTLKELTPLNDKAEEFYQQFIALVPNIKAEEQPTLRAGCQYLADFYTINEMKLEFTTEDRDSQRLNAILRYKKTCFDSWMEVARRFGLTQKDAPQRSPKTMRKATRETKTPLRKENGWPQQ